MYKCTVDGCDKEATHKGKTICAMHAHRLRRHGDFTTRKKDQGSGVIVNNGYIMIRCLDKVYRYQHILVAERILGKPLPHGAIIHHVDGCKYNNEPSNLVICPDKSYHNLIHKRMKELGYENN